MTSFLRLLTGFMNRPKPNMAEPPDSQGGVFENQAFAIVRGNSITEDLAATISSQLRLHGGEVSIDKYPHERLKLNEVSYIIADIYDFPDYYEAVDHFVPVVTPAWIPASIATGKLAHPRKFSPDPHLFMSDVIATCADLPKGDKDAIAGGILAMGGNYAGKLTAACTHLIALSTDNEKAEQVMKNNLKTQIVLPHWFDDCLKLGRRISEAPYLLPDPEILRGPETRAPEPLPNKHIAGATTATPNTPHPPKMDGRSKLEVFKNRKVFFDSDLAIGGGLRDILQGMILASDGKVVKKAATADMVICKYREGANFEIAMQKRLDVGNLSWLYYLITHDKWTSPYRRLLHFPLPKEPLEGFENYKIGLSNYTGEARTYLENLIVAAGAECTKNLKSDNTHLITAHRKSEKATAAEEWGVNVVNHLWLEESYAKWKKQSVSITRYNQFPKGTNLGDVVGMTQIDRQVIETCFLEQTSPLPPVSTRPEAFDNSAQRPSRNAKISAETPTRSARTPLPANNLAMSETPAPPSSVTSRRSKTAANAKLSDLTSDIALYEKERKRVGGVVYGGRRKDDADRANVVRKRPAETIDSTEEVQSSAKKQRTGSVKPVKLLLTGYQAWIGQVDKEEEETKELEVLGISLVEKASTATHLAAPNILRTPKFFLGMAHALPVISTDYIEACLDAGERLDPLEFKLGDEAGETSMGVSLEEATANARSKPQQLLKGFAIYSIEKISSNIGTLREIVEANGSTLRPFKGRASAISPSPKDGEKDYGVFLLSNGGTDDKSLRSKFIKLAEDNGREAHVVVAEWLLKSSLRQEVQPAEEYEVQDD